MGRHRKPSDTERWWMPGDAVVLPAPARFRRAPPGAHVAEALQAVQHGIQHAVGPLQAAARQFAHALEDRVAVAVPFSEDGQHQRRGRRCDEVLAGDPPGGSPRRQVCCRVSLLASQWVSVIGPWNPPTFLPTFNSATTRVRKIEVVDEDVDFRRARLTLPPETVPARTIGFGRNDQEARCQGSATAQNRSSRSSVRPR